MSRVPMTYEESLQWEPVAYKEIRLERERFQIGMKAGRISVRDRHHWELEQREDMIARLTYEVYGRRAERTVSWPETWWDAVKQRWFPAWALKRWPVVMHVETVTARALFPELHPVERSHLIIYSVENT